MIRNIDGTSAEVLDLLSLGRHNGAMIINKFYPLAMLLLIN